MLQFIDLRTGESLKGDFCSVLCLGNFDGVHIGHRKLIKETLSFRDELLLKKSGIIGGAWCFKQPPADFLSRIQAKAILSLDEKLEIFAESGLEVAMLGDFAELSKLSPKDFVDNILKQQCKCVGAVCGFNFKFGKERAGNSETLSELLEGSVRVVPPVLHEGNTVCSTAIRNYIMLGEPEKAEEMLGRPYFVNLPVEHGKHLGRKLGTPTINQLIPEGRLTPKIGVYAGYTEVDGNVYPSVSNVGLNPTVEDGDRVKCETYIIGFSGDLYEKKVKVNFCKYLRGEVKFSGTDELSVAIHRDAESAYKYFCERFGK